MIRRTQKLPNVKTSIKTKLNKGFFGLKSLEAGEVSVKQIETVRKLLAPYCRKKIKLFWRIKPFFVKTAKAFGSRMGSGKGMASTAFVKVRKGQLLFEVNSFTIKIPILLLKKIHSKFAVKTIYIYKGL